MGAVPLEPRTIGSQWAEHVKSATDQEKTVGCVIVRPGGDLGGSKPYAEWGGERTHSDSKKTGGEEKDASSSLG